MESDNRWRARVEIGDLVSRYTRTGDTGREDEFADLFAEDAVFEVSDRDSARGAAEIKQLMEKVKRAFAGANPAFFPARHHVSSLNITFEDDDHATGRSYFHLVGGWGSDHWGVYRDSYVRTERGWKFSFRRAALEGTVPHSPMAFLLRDEPWPS